MAPTLKASEPGLAKIKQARNERGWTIEDDRWLLEASKILKPEQEWQPGCYADGCSETTWKRFLRGQPITSPVFKAFCQILELNWEEIVDRSMLREATSDFVESKQPAVNSRRNWGEALLEFDAFYGRTDELTMLKQWIVEDACHVVALVGMGGIGKTALSVKLAQQIQDKFDYVVWRSLRDDQPPPLSKLLVDWLQYFSGQPESSLPTSASDRISQLLDYLRQYRCLLILDAWEVVLSSGKLVGHYLESYEGYGELIRRVGASEHRSCLILTSREKPREVVFLERDMQYVRSLKLEGLGIAAREIFQQQHLSDEHKWEEVIHPYEGNPLALKIVAAMIQEFFDGSVATFLKNPTLFLGELEFLLYQQLARLSTLEQNIMNCLATNEHPLNPIQIKLQINPSILQSDILNALQSLDRRCLVEKVKQEFEILFTLQPVVKKYIKKQSLNS
ncbi:NB-ARC domain-containing protein [Aerosakkonema funiforme]|uniref:NB-ARC domain-containing protein n=1 Tax=Aerosakkonema funiforme TaxID=1246630 RepID=UPI0035B7A445